MGITLVKDYTAAPKIQVTIGSPDGTAISSITLYRVVGTTLTLTRVQPSSGASTAYIEDFEMPWDVPVAYRSVMTYNAGYHDVNTSLATTVVPSTAWAIHPLAPSLSFPLDAGSFAVAGVTEHGDTAWAATRTLHDVLDSPYPVPVRVGSGARKASATSLRVSTRTAAEAGALRAALNDQTPLLIRVPGSFQWDWEAGYYDVGDVTAGRVLQFGPLEDRVFTLPLQRVAEPVGTQQANWSYPQLTTDFADYPSLTAAFADYPSLQANNRS